MQGIYTYVPETNYVPREYSVAAILLLLFIVLISLAPVLNLFYYYYYYYYYYYSIGRVVTHEYIHQQTQLSLWPCKAPPLPLAPVCLVE